MVCMLCDYYVLDLLEETERVPEAADDEESSPFSAFLFFRFPSMTDIRSIYMNLASMN